MDGAQMGQPRQGLRPMNQISQPSPVLEIVRFRLRPGVDPQAFTADAARMDGWLATRPVVSGPTGISKGRCFHGADLCK